MKKSNLILLAATLVTASFGTALAQDYPPNPQPGKCYARCMIPDQYEDLTEEILTKQATQRLEIIPARFEQAEERVEVQGAATRLEVVPAVYETVTERIEVKPATFRLEPVAAVYGTVDKEVMVRPEEVKLVEVPAVYETVTEQIEVSPASTKWVKRKGDKNCLSQDPDDCLVWCLVEVAPRYETLTKTVMKTAPTTKEVIVPAEYRKTTDRVVKTPPTTRRVEIPAEYKTITKTVVVKPAETKTVEIPAEYKNLKKTVLVQPAETRVTEIPAEYRTVSNRRLVKAGGFSEWREVLCQNKVNAVKIREIQAALKSRGYDPGPVDNVMGGKTKAALVKFQKDNGLPTGQLDFDTLRALGVSY